MSEQQRVAHAITLLASGARCWYLRSEPLLDPPLETFADFEALVRANFPLIGYLNYYRDKIKTIQQYTSEMKYVRSSS
jgi:hypothetical protein